ncbi:class I SAM-dependent methyltransferase [Pseudobacteriovorax antillogorgiicola]|uniref:Methyltransferase domain-containing protein n=1 Tax=Pseudobacteriovorax antillogorgiicola TaxID=1513793 RepID=A0A1Y6C536_9BACT|nr:class I SAM-dependent methyltransferase [Pseudobacteriovorax antillogorgiicola]TCS51208.1 methyltransferase family protein [Pseudobacteriovorax antillogorgiicola]SMF37186.1 Methyltransferase domain-containing protein [Pseudobacteriovorax antillogorgiicola]
MMELLSQASAWDAVAIDYDRVNRQFMLEFSRSALKSISLQANWRVLDVACGPGTTSLYLSEFVDQVDAVDFSPKMIQVLKRNIKAEHIDNIFPMEANGQDLPFDESRFDLVVSMFGLMFFPERLQGLREIYRVLKPGAPVVLSSWALAEKSSFMQTLGAAFAFFHDEEATGGAFPWSETADIKSDLDQVGFNSVQIEEVYHEFEVGPIDRFWANIVKGSAPLVDRKQRMTPEEWGGCENRALEYLKSHLHEESVLGTTAWIITAHRD